MDQRHSHDPGFGLLKVGRVRGVSALLAWFAITACAPVSLYDWGDYEDSLYLRYTDQDFGQAESHLHDSLASVNHPSRVPPGVYADYGFLLYRRGDYTGALEYFEREKKAFPESSALMTKLSERVRSKMSADANPEAKVQPQREGALAQ